MTTTLSKTTVKLALRRDMKKQLKLLTTEQTESASITILQKLALTSEYLNASGVSVYLSMNGEVNTEGFVRDAFLRNKRVFIPKILGKQPQDMFMLEVESLEQLQSFPLDKWGIPDPPMSFIDSSKDGIHSGLIDVVLMPGVAFDSKCARLGHGKGYYGMKISSTLSISLLITISR